MRRGWAQKRAAAAVRVAWRWRARQAAFKAGQGAASGPVAWVASGNEGWPWSAARQGTAGLFGRLGDDGGASPSAWRGVCVNGRRPARAHLSEVGRGQRRGEAARRQRGSKAAAAAQRGSERTRAQVPARAHRAERRESAGKRERGEREREWREGEKVSGLTWFKLKIFNGNSKNFEHESCSKLNFLQLSF